MITFTFYLLRPEDETSVIMGALRSSKLRATFSVGLRTETKHWDKKTQCVVKSSPDFAFISEKLAIHKSTVLKEIRTGELDNLSLVEIRDRILVSMGRTTISKSALQYAYEASTIAVYGGGLAGEAAGGYADISLNSITKTPVFSLCNLLLYCLLW